MSEHVGDDVASLRQRLHAAEQRLRLYEGAFNQLSVGFYILHLEDPADPASLVLIAANPAVSRISGFDIMAEIGERVIKIYPNGLETGLLQIYAAVARDGGSRDLGEVQYGDDRVTASFFAIRAFQVAQDYVCVMVDSITERKRAEEAIRQTVQQEEIIRTQAAVLEELSTPLIPISDEVVIMPLIGSLDSQRAQRVLDTLLAGVAATHARVVILDITGVPVVDTQVADALLRAAQAVKLLGAQVVLTGIRPEVAQTLVGLGIDLAQVVTGGSLQSGIAYALASLRQPAPRRVAVPAGA